MYMGYSMHLQGPTLPKVLAQMCNDILVDTVNVCQAFTWDHIQQRAYFKGQNVNGTLGLGNLEANFTLCNSPNVTTWILNSGDLLYCSSVHPQNLLCNSKLCPSLQQSQEEFAGF